MESNKEEQITTVAKENIYKLNGRVPLRKALNVWLTACTGDVRSRICLGTDRVVRQYFRSNGAYLSSAEITQLLQCM